MRIEMQIPGKFGQFDADHEHHSADNRQRKHGKDVSNRGGQENAGEDLKRPFNNIRSAGARPKVILSGQTSCAVTHRHAPKEGENQVHHPHIERKLSFRSICNAKLEFRVTSLFHYDSAALLACIFLY